MCNHYSESDISLKVPKLEIFEKKNMAEIFINTNVILYSYQTPVGFKKLGKPAVISENLWGSTTGKHINIFAKLYGIDKKNRLKRSEFIKQLNEIF